MKEAYRGFAKKFGVYTNPVMRGVFKKGKSRIYTMDEMAKILLKEGLVEDLDDGVTEASSLIRNGIMGEFRWKRGYDDNADIRYFLKYEGKRKK